VVDTPGIKSFGVWDLEQSDIQDYFIEIAHKARECKFNSCSHLHEPDCAVQEAVESEEIHPIRYASYCQLMDSVGLKHRRR
jgi:ribosome biogenesis GTPase